MISLFGNLQIILFSWWHVPVMESLPLTATCQGRCEVSTLSSDMKYCFGKSLSSDSYTLIAPTAIPLLCGLRNC
jgi:hypothetical protein